MADCPSIHSTDFTCFTRREWRKIIVMHKASFGLNFHTFNYLSVARTAQSQSRENVRATAIENARAVKNWRNAAGFSEQWPQFVHFSTIWPALVFYRLAVNQFVYFFLTEKI